MVRKAMKENSQELHSQALDMEGRKGRKEGIRVNWGKRKLWDHISFANLLQRPGIFEPCSFCSWHIPTALPVRWAYGARTSWVSCTQLITLGDLRQSNPNEELPQLRRKHFSLTRLTSEGFKWADVSVTARIIYKEGQHKGMCSFKF